MITKEEIDNIAMLSKLCVSLEEYSAVREDLQRMIGFIDIVRNTDTAEYEDSFRNSCDRFCRDDTVKDSYSREQILENAPLCDGEFFVVRKRA